MEKPIEIPYLLLNIRSSFLVLRMNCISIPKKSITLFLAIMMLATPSLSVHAQEVLNPFGGITSYSIFCFCSFSFLTCVGGEVGSGCYSLVPIPGITYFREFQPIYTAWQIGLTGQAQYDCIQYSGNSCIDLGTYPYVLRDGTSYVGGAINL